MVGGASEEASDITAWLNAHFKPSLYSRSQKQPKKVSRRGGIIDELPNIRHRKVNRAGKSFTPLPKTRKGKER